VTSWWVSPISQALGDEARGHSDRRYFRLLVPKQQIFEVYRDTVANVWVLDMVQD
jgi:hypothetical protein